MLSRPVVPAAQGDVPADRDSIAHCHTLSQTLAPESRLGHRASQESLMRKLRIGVIDLVARGPTRAWFARVMNANLASIMPQVVGVWCREEGHQVTFFCYTGI